MKKLLSLLMILILSAAAAAEDSPAQGVLSAFLEGDYARIETMLSDDVRAMLTADQLRQGWEMQLAALGSFIEVVATQADGGTEALTLRHEGGAQNLIVAADAQGRISGILLQPVQSGPEAAERVLPEGCTEQAVTLFEGSERALGGRLILPAGENAPFVVLAHGSGPSDMDETIYANKPFRDLAYDLAVLGVGSIRFDKITYAHPELPCPTVEEEYLAPVTEALRVLRECASPSHVFLIGHSQGGMLMPWLVQQCGFDGGIALAGTPRALWELSLQQNLDTIALMPAEVQPLYLAQIEAERMRAEAMDALSEEEAMQAAVFGMNAYYLRHMASLDQITIAKETGKPMLFLWGEADVQVGRADFDAWRSGLGTDDLYTYISYPGLNHLFIPAQEGENITNITSAYAVPGCMDARIAHDIAAWLGK